jgi:tight adherence protein C
MRALSRFSEEMRTKRRQRAEEAAAKTKIKILFPLVLFIFPCIFIVLLGPAMLNIAKTLATFK